MVRGMSGSPIISDDGKAIGIATLTGSETNPGTPNARLLRSLPGWLLRGNSGRPLVREM
jgi:hypothetical protein